MKKIQISCCYDCTYLYDLYIKNSLWCNLISEKIADANVIDPKCKLEEY